MYPKQFDHLNCMKGTLGDYQLDNDNEFNTKLISLAKMIYLILVKSHLARSLVREFPSLGDQTDTPSGHVSIVEYMELT